MRRVDTVKVARNLLVGCAGAALLLAASSGGRAWAEPSSQTTSAWTGYYFANPNLQGEPAFVRDDANIAFDWGDGSPGNGLSEDSFSVRWTRWAYADTAGPWALTVVADDGVRVFVDDNLAIDAWYDQPVTAHTATVSLTQAYHLVRMEYYKRNSPAQARLLLTSPSYPDWRGEYFDNPDLVGEPSFVRNDSAIDFDFASAGPGGGVPGTNFSARWTSGRYFQAGEYRFTTTSDDGVRLWVDGQLLLDQWHDETPTSYSANAQLTAGNHFVEMDFYQHGGDAQAKLTVALLPGQEAWHGDYFANPGLQGTPALSRDDAAINFDWGRAAPVAKWSQATNWSARWTTKRNMASPGYFTVTAYADDGVRVWVDDHAVIDEWHDSSPTTYAAMVYLDAGEHDWRIEYYQHQGTASLRVEIAPGAALPGDAFQAGPDSGVLTIDSGSAYFVKGGRTDGWQTTDDGNGGTAVRMANLLFGQADSNWVRWYAPLARPGMVDVSVFIPVGIGTTRQARYWITHAGANDSKSLNQSLYSGQWVSLGAYHFDAGGDEYVSVSNVTYETSQSTTVVADSVRFSPR